MNTVIFNKYADVLNTLNVEVSKKLEGEYTVDEIISTFGNYFFNKMFLDITAIKDYKDITNLQKLSMNINMDKVILLLDKDDPISDSKVFLSKLVSIGIYNFTKDSNNLMYLFTNPNTYRDVAYYQDISDNSDNNNSGNNISENDISHNMTSNSKRIIGFKNVTEGAGATTLMYMIKKVLDSYYKTVVVEVDSRDYSYFKDKDSATIKEEDLPNLSSKYNDADVILVDLNKSKKDYLCTDTLYLVEPSTIKLKKLTFINPNIFRELDGKKVIFNKCLLSENEVTNFEMEANIKAYYVIPPINDRDDNRNVLLPLLSKLGYVTLSDDEKDLIPQKKGFLSSLFK